MGGRKYRECAISTYVDVADASKVGIAIRHPAVAHHRAGRWLSITRCATEEVAP